MRFLLFAVVTLLSLPARADLFTMQLEKQDASHTRILVGTDDAKKTFNAANCACHNHVDVEMRLAGIPANMTADQSIDIWVGSNCAVFTTDREDRCKKLASFPAQMFVTTTSPFRLSVDVADVVSPKANNCSVGSGNNNIFALVDIGNNSSYEYTWPETPLVIAYDTSAASLPTGLKSTPVEDGTEVSWTVPSVVTDIRYYQVLCASSIDGSPVLIKPASNPEYIRTSDIKGCTASQPGAPDAGITTGTPDAGTHDGGVPDGGEVDATEATADAGESSGDLFAKFNALDPEYICSGRVSNTASSARIDLSSSKAKEFSPDEKILTKVVVIDQYFNPGAADAPASGQPIQVRDGWEVYHDAGGTADGGFCFVATAVYGDYDHPYVKVLRRFRDETLARSEAGRGFISWYYAHSPPWAEWLRRHPVARVAAAVGLFPVVALAWLWNVGGPVGIVLFFGGIVWLRRMRRRRKLLLAAAAVAVLVAGLQPARAQVMLEEDAKDEPLGLPDSWWAFEIKVGPYYPDIDGESGLTGKPYETMFGSGKSILPQMELDRFFFHPYGELGLGASIGYMWNSAKSFAQDENGVVTSMRSADDTGFKLFPLALMVVYRSTALADRTVIPIVPYAKVGLSYYIWQITKGDGSTAEISGQKGRGATLGWQGTLGLALRADRLDPEAARGLESDLGVEHAGFFFDVTYANVSGLFQSNRLHVGDFTWAAGVNFEF
jgi:hypothetical protein